MGANSSKDKEAKDLSAVTSFVSVGESGKMQELLSTIQGKKVANLMQLWHGLMDKRLQQHVQSYVASTEQPTDVDSVKFMKLFCHLVRGSIFEKTDVFIDLVTDLRRTEPIDRRILINYVEGLVSSLIPLHKNTVWPKGTKAGIDSLTSSLCSELPPEVTHEHIKAWLSEEPKITLMHSAVIGNLFKIPTAKQELLPTIDKKPGNLLDIPSVILINGSLPAELRKEWRLLYSSHKHGESFSKLLGFITKQGPTVIVVKDKGGAVFGGFAPEAWTLSPKFSGNDKSFLFKIKPTMKVYNGCLFNNHYQYLNVQQQTMPNGLGMGGQHGYWGLWLDSEFGQGHSSESCTTFLKYSMLSTTKEFHIDALEVWAVGPKPVVDEEEEGQRSILDSNVEAKAMLEMMGKKSHSDGLREPET